MLNCFVCHRGLEPHTPPIPTVLVLPPQEINNGRPSMLLHLLTLLDCQKILNTQHVFVNATGLEPATPTPRPELCPTELIHPTSACTPLMLQAESAPSNFSNTYGFEPLTRFPPSPGDKTPSYYHHAVPTTPCIIPHLKLWIMQE
jgi:hypothetical protein